MLPRNLMVTMREPEFRYFFHEGDLRRRSTGALDWSAATKAALAKPEVRMGVLLMLPFFGMELPRSELLRLEYVLGE